MNTRKAATIAAAAAAIGVGGLTAAAFSPISAIAQQGGTTPTTAPAAPDQAPQGQAPQGQPGMPGQGRHGHGPGGQHGAPHAAAIAGAIGISESDLATALQSGKTIAQVAQDHGVDPQKVIDALAADENKEIDERLAAGDLTQAEADQMKANATQHATDMVNGTMKGGPGHGPGGDHDGHGPGGQHGAPHAAAIAGAIGISESDLATALQSGKTIAQVAQDHGVDPQKVIDALAADENKEIDERLAAGDLTQAEADQMKANATQHATDVVNGTMKGGPGHGPGGHGKGGHHGPGGQPGTGSTGSTTPSSQPAATPSGVNA